MTFKDTQHTDFLAMRANLNSFKPGVSFVGHRQTE